ncbi:MAG: hypothetical protein Q8W51_08370 [Candidatus Palauibacterales bacterium]|nr:hypothetical protein [Candidatus Palauibacterales bacterium]MDP2529739.1 hypothetical protein [Candidatus Palauibacterales bacterium]MDP2583163.1 hypothetical protein [Candidatus Palauibacterales bacterium]
MSLARALERGSTTEFDDLQTRVLSTEGTEDPVPYAADGLVGRMGSRARALMGGS